MIKFDRFDSIISPSSSSFVYFSSSSLLLLWLLLCLRSSFSESVEIEVVDASKCVRKLRIRLKMLLMDDGHSFWAIILLQYIQYEISEKATSLGQVSRVSELE